MRPVPDSGQILAPIMSGDTTTGQEIVVPIQQLDPEDILSECNWMFEVENQTIKDRIPGQESVVDEREDSEEDVDDSCDSGHDNHCL